MKHGNKVVALKQCMVLNVFMPPPAMGGGGMYSGRPSGRPSVRPLTPISSDAISHVLSARMSSLLANNNNTYIHTLYHVSAHY